MSDIVRIGVVGAGSISVRGILPHLAQDDVQDRVRMTAVCDPAPGRAKAAAEKFNIPSAFESYEELLDATENRTGTNHPQILAALSQPVEKSFMLSQIEQIQRLVKGHDEDGLREKFKQMVQGYQNGAVEKVLEA